MPLTKKQTNGSAPTTAGRTAPQQTGVALSSDEDFYEDEDSTEGEDFEGFQAKKRLPVSTFIRRNLQSLMSLISNGFLDLNPDYQREVVWPLTRMSKLIDSLMENYYVPPVLFNVEKIPDDDGGAPKYKRTCVDGKQRLSSIRDFLEGKIPCHDRKGSPWYFCRDVDEDGVYVPRRGRHYLPESVKKDFLKKDILCCEYRDLKQYEERSIFQRVQLGMALTSAEQFRATEGPWQALVLEYEEEFPDVVNLCKNRRALGFRRLLTCFAQIYEAQDPTAADGIPRIKHGVQQLQNFCKNEASLNAKTRAHLHGVFTLFSALITSYPEIFRDRGFRYTKTFAPVELIAVSVLLSQYMDKRPEGLLKGDIVAFREQMRALHSDLTLNENTWRSAWNFIDDLERYRGTTDGSTKPKKNARLADRVLAKAIQSSQESVLDPRAKKVAKPRGQAVAAARAAAEQEAEGDVPTEPTNARDGSPEVKNEDEERGERSSRSPLIEASSWPSQGRASRPAPSMGRAGRPPPAVGGSGRPMDLFTPTMGGTSQPASEADGVGRKRAFEAPSQSARPSLIAAKRARLSEVASTGHQD